MRPAATDGRIILLNVTSERPMHSNLQRPVSGQILVSSESDVWVFTSGGTRLIEQWLND